MREEPIKPDEVELAKLTVMLLHKSAFGMPLIAFEGMAQQALDRAHLILRMVREPWEDPRRTAQVEHDAFIERIGDLQKRNPDLLDLLCKREHPDGSRLTEDEVLTLAVLDAHPRTAKSVIEEFKNQYRQENDFSARGRGEADDMLTLFFNARGRWHNCRDESFRASAIKAGRKGALAKEQQANAQHGPALSQPVEKLDEAVIKTKPKRRGTKK